MTRLLASVRNLAEARLAASHGAGLIDLKEPSAGALGAVDAGIAREVAHWLGGRLPLSAAAGDIHQNAAPHNVAAAFTDAGVHYVKFGFDPARAGLADFEALAAATREAHVVAVCRAESPQPPALIGRLAAAGVSGIMLDTMDKDGPGLTALLDPASIQRFVREVRRLGLLCGLAGRLTLADAAALTAAEADYLGFRTALCEDGVRDGCLSASAIEALVTIVSGGSAAAESARSAR